jgi:hypothetical protein
MPATATSAPAQAAAEPAATSAPAQAAAEPTAAATAAVIMAPTLERLTNEERWRREQVNRQPFPALRTYTTSGSELWWFDPINQQHVILGHFAGDFQVQATFTLRGQGVAALEVPYHVNQGYGLTSLSPALLDRIRAAGYGEWIETYVFEGPNVQSR